MLNRSLYLTMLKNFGVVRITNENVERVEVRVPGGKSLIHIAGEHYNVCCPLCGDDRYRLSASYKWLSLKPMSTVRTTHLIHCYNEECAAWQPSFWEKLLPDLEAAGIGLLDNMAPPDLSAMVPKVNRKTRLPKGMIPIDQLPDDHEAVQFLRKQYNLSPIYMAKAYGACWVPEPDPIFEQAKRRVVFPIYQQGQVYSWQGRSIDPNPEFKWYMPPGFVKCYYNSDRVAPHETPIVAEGITSAIACGPRGLAIFGKYLNSMRAKEFGERWQSVVIATDPDTFVPDNRKGGGGRIFAMEMAALLKPYVRTIRMINWPKDVLALATKNNNGEKTKIPDAADLGLKVMKGLIDAAL